ncbi:MAG: peptidoglycan DD-metalloendopeptidase family protein [Deltaproteobacteria bacterium]|nr:peptidoglycan DD-metalloendopeptidase family protein [Deltaproteobacteria bacterium]MCB9785604.1 peptidoglycan DD-metalloendopeptidase family protein [Deltaproteobacteria bacterium]
MSAPRPALVCAALAGALLLVPRGAYPDAAKPDAEAPAPEASGKPDAAAAVDPSTLLVPKMEPPEPRQPTTDVNKLLRAELSMLEALDDLETNIIRRSSELTRLREQEKVVERDLGTMAERFTHLTERIDRARALTHRRLRAMIQLKRTEPYQVLFASGDYATFMRRVRAVQTLLASDKARVDAYRTQLADWRRARDDLERRRQNLVRTREAIEIMLQQLEWDREEKQALLDSVRERSPFQKKLSDEMNSVDEELQAKVAAMADRERPRLWMQETKGNLSMPIRNGRIVGGFGVRVHPKFGTRTVHRGIDVVPDKWDGKSPVEVRAIYWGYVAYVGRLRGLGTTVILDHTRGYMTLYAHLESASVEVGQKVKTGETIGLMGDSGSLTGKHLYMELRYEGKAEDPRPWIQ